MEVRFALVLDFHSWKYSMWEIEGRVAGRMVRLFEERLLYNSFFVSGCHCDMQQIRDSGDNGLVLSCMVVDDILKSVQ